MTTDREEIDRLSRDLMAFVAEYHADQSAVTRALELLEHDSYRIRVRLTDIDRRLRELEGRVA